MRPRSITLAVSGVIAAFMPLIPAATVPATAVTATSATTTEVTVTRSLSGSFTASRPSRWSGQVSVDEESASATGRAASRRVSVDVMLVRRSCDVAGCVETVIRTEGATAALTAAAGLATAQATGASVPVRVRRYRVEGSDYTVIEDRLAAMPLVVVGLSTGSDLRTTYRSVGGGVVSTASGLQVKAQITLTLGATRLSTATGSMAWNRRVTVTQQPPASPS